MKRRHLVRSIPIVVMGSAGCVSNLSELAKTPAHTVSVYNYSEKKSRNVNISIRNSTGEVLFERSYTMSGSAQASEDDTFPASSDLSTVIITVDGKKYERVWPASDCGASTWEGIEVKIFGKTYPEKEIFTGGNCQTVYTDS